MAAAMSYENLREALINAGKITKGISGVAKFMKHLPIPGLSEIAKTVEPLLDSYANALNPNNDTAVDLQKIKEGIEKQLAKLKGKILIFVDDIDRLNKSEIR